MDADHQAIVELTADYQRLREVFLPDATATLGSSDQDGVDEIIERVSTSLAKYSGSQHMVSTHEIAVDGDTATSRCYLHAQHIRPDGEQPPLFTLAGIYADDLIRTPDGWRIRHRTLTTLWTTGR